MVKIKFLEVKIQRLAKVAYPDRKASIYNECIRVIIVRKCWSSAEFVPLPVVWK